MTEPFSPPLLPTDAPAARGAGADRVELMQTFVRIVEAGSLSAAAALLGTTQPTVSRRLQMLERSLGLRLLQRSTHRMKLTEDGERCFARAKELVTSWEAFEADLRGGGDDPQGTLRVLVPHAFGQEMMIGALADFLERYAGMRVHWFLQDREPDFIAEGIDCAIHVGELRDPSNVAISLTDVPRIVVASPELLRGRPLPSHPSDLVSWPWLSLTTFYRNDITLTHEQTHETASVAFEPRMSTDNLYALRSAAIRGLGVSVCSAWLIAEDVAQGRLIQLVPSWRSTALPMYLIYPYAKYYPARLRRFIEAMRAAIPVVIDAEQRKIR
ncbi:LysR substrate-binding domain-containing protein [Pandoraea terrigena]|uniref:HTH-type transcriptional regulator DmlR n=1 Tax=Pandoraea terrigena TaxID=2508292 RepID=A0A5E4TET7_9BURK|nr:LysR substrate-binding domain-containing protein [Pandoraea terrigena]VVD84944.1 HTH-type transcriptional regulator DmlR [Pandoraea terrigena]